MKLLLIFLFIFSLNTFSATNTKKLNTFNDCMEYSHLVTVDIHQKINGAQEEDNENKIHTKEIKSEMGKVYSAVLTACMLSLKPRLQ